MAAGRRQTHPMADTDSSTASTTGFERPSEDELRRRLTPEQFAVTQQAGTEPAFTGVYWDDKTAGTYRCVVCGLDLFESDTKYESGSGWPSFWKPIADDRVDAEDRHQPRHGPHRGHLRPLRRPPRPRLPRRAPSPPATATA